LEIKVTLRNPLHHNEQIVYEIEVFDNALARDWVMALKEILLNKKHLEKNYCFLGFPNTARDDEYLCNKLKHSVDTINSFFDDYYISEEFTPSTIRNGLDPNQTVMNQLHNHFEVLQGTVENLSDYYRRADYKTKYAIRQLNNICHELESWMLTQRKLVRNPEWVRSSQITTFLQCQRYDLRDEHRDLFNVNGYDRKFGHVYMHWTQIGKTLFEVFRDEGAPELTDTVCEAITHLRYYSGEFDIEWGNDVVLGDPTVPWHNEEQEKFRAWLLENDLDPTDPQLSLGYLPLGKVRTEDLGNSEEEIRQLLGKHLDIYKIEVDGISNTFDYCWSDPDHEQQQIDQMREGYDYSSKTIS